MKLLDLLRKYVVPSVLGGIAMDSYRRQLTSHSNDLSKLELEKNGVIQQIQNELWSDKVVNSEFKTKLVASSSRVTEVEENLQHLRGNLEDVNSKLSNSNFTSIESKDFLINKQNYLTNELVKLEKTKDGFVKELQEVINKSDISSYISDLLETYRSFINQLNLEQLVALFNIMGYIMILFTLISITTLLIGDYLIDNFKLEIRYPKLSRYIRIKQTLNKHYLMFNIIIIYIIVIVFIIMNIYMLLLKYFV